MPSFTYGLYPFTWGLTPFGRMGHQPPAGAKSLLDFRTLAHQATPGPTPGLGFHAFSGTPPSDLISLGTGYAPELVIDSAARNELKVKIGLSDLPAGNMLADALSDVLGRLADPTGGSGPKPVSPTSDGVFEIHLAGHSLIKSWQFDPSALLAPNPKGHYSHLRDMARNEFLSLDAQGFALPVIRRALGAMLLKCGVSRAEVKAGAPGRAAAWQGLLPKSLRDKHGAALKPEEPHTQLVELWPNDGAVTSQTYAWAQQNFAPWASSGSAVASNKLGNTSNGTLFHGCRCTTPVSSADHWVSGVLRVNGNYQAHLLTRMAAGAATCYLGGFYSDGSLNTNFLTKYVLGVGTTLAIGPNIAPSRLPTATSAETGSNGSTQSFQLTGFSTLTVTDTAITGNLYGGAGSSDAANNFTNYVGPVTIDDRIAAAPVADFSASPRSGTASLSVAFTDLSTNTPTSWTWERSSDGGSIWSTFSTAQNPTAAFSAGTWAIRLTAANAGGSDGETKTAYITVDAASGNGHKRRMLTGIG